MAKPDSRIWHKQNSWLVYMKTSKRLGSDQLESMNIIVVHF